MFLLKARKTANLSRGRSFATSTIVVVLPDPATASTIRESVVFWTASKMTACCGDGTKSLMLFNPANVLFDVVVVGSATKFDLYPLKCGDYRLSLFAGVAKANGFLFVLDDVYFGHTIMSATTLRSPYLKASTWWMLPMISLLLSVVFEAMTSTSPCSARIETSLFMRAVIFI